MFDWVIGCAWQCLESVNFDLCKIELLEIELFDHGTVCKQTTGVSDT